MKSIITRNLINKNIIFSDFNESFEEYKYTYDDLSGRIDFYKNYLLSIGCKQGESVLIGYSCGIDQISLVFAVCELGLNFIINDYKILDNDFDFIDTKTKILLPIDYYFDYDNASDFKKSYMSMICKHSITKSDLDDYHNYDKNDLILSNRDDVLMKCTSSGTTGTPKLVQHTHEFLLNISNRNKMFFDGTVGLSYNLNHGSSLATYFLPALFSERVNKFVNMPAHLMRRDGYITHIKEIDDVIHTFDHLMVPYENQLNRVLENYDSKKISYYTLTSITPLLYQKRDRCKDIISFFGCNETSGPLLINRASFSNFRRNVYQKVDDYYEIKSIDPLTIHLKEYGVDLNTNDVFEIEDGFKFIGRKDLLRINGIEIQSELYDEILESLNIDGSFIYDTAYNEIYLAIWEECDIKLKYINSNMNRISNDAHSVSKYAILDKNKFVSGVKLDQELLRCYFRDRIE